MFSKILITIALKVTFPCVSNQLVNMHFSSKKRNFPCSDSEESSAFVIEESGSSASLSVCLLLKTHRKVQLSALGPESQPSSYSGVIFWVRKASSLRDVAPPEAERRRFRLLHAGSWSVGCSSVSQTCFESPARTLVQDPRLSSKQGRYDHQKE
jgi:hypothetical protein